MRSHASVADWTHTLNICERSNCLGKVTGTINSNNRPAAGSIVDDLQHRGQDVKAIASTDRGPGVVHVPSSVPVSLGGLVSFSTSFTR
jgi:hypothetical protein